MIKSAIPFQFVCGLRTVLRRGRSRTRLPFVLVSVALSLTLGCTQKKPQDENLAVFHGFEKDDVRTWDPANAYDSVSLDLLPSVMETLYQYSYLTDVYQIEPLLAAEMPRYSKDRLTVTIPIKKGIRFQDDPCFKQSQGKGREMTVKDLIYGMKRLALPSLDSRGWWVLDEKVVGINAFREKLQKANKKDIPKIMEEEVTGLKALDDYTLQIKLTKPYPQLPYILAMSFTAPIASEAVAYHADERGNLTDHPVGTGPFMLTRWEHNHAVILHRNPNFRG